MHMYVVCTSAYRSDHTRTHIATNKFILSGMHLCLQLVALIVHTHTTNPHNQMQSTEDNTLFVMMYLYQNIYFCLRFSNC